MRRVGSVIAGLLAGVTLAGVFAGCRTSAAHPPATQPVATIRPVDAEFRRVSVLLDFETDRDLLFVAGDAQTPSAGTAHARSGARSLLLRQGSRRLDVKLGALVSGREFPGTWTLAGCYLYSDRPADATVSVGGTPRQVRIAAGAWVPVMADLATLRTAGGADEAEFVVEFDGETAGRVWADDVLLADNAKVLVAPSEGIDGEGWSVRLAGFTYAVARERQFKVDLPTDDLPGGWTCQEANRIRARFRSETGKTRNLTLYSDGRTYWDGVYRDLRGAGGDVGRPGAVRVDAEQGRVDRNTDGDANHDGYNEVRGAYEVVAAGGRKLGVTLVAPRGGGVMDRPVIEVRDLPPGDVRATVEGTLAVDVLRLADGRVLVAVPAAIQRETVVTLRVR